MPICRVCSVELTKYNTKPSALERHQFICRKCLAEYEKNRRKNLKKQKIAEENILRKNILGGLNIRILAHAKAGENMYFIDKIDALSTSSFAYNNWGDFIAKLKKILQR